MPFFSFFTHAVSLGHTQPLPLADEPVIGSGEHIVVWSSPLKAA
jgi:hypothetical protein